jgi:hypothetical protein
MSNVSHYKENGFYIHKQLLPKDLILSVIDDVNRLAMLKLKSLNIEPMDELPGNLRILFTVDESAYLGVVKLAAKLVSIKSLVLDSRIQNAVKGLGLEVLTKPTEAIFHIMSRQLKPSNGYMGFKPHQDWTSIQGSLDSVVVWTPLTVVDEESFPLQVIPGSHLGGLLKIEKGEYETSPSEYDDSKFVSAIMEPGDVAFMSSWTVHRTGTDPGNKFRAAISTRYENAAESTFIENNYQGAYRRWVHRDPIIPDFPSKEQVLNIFK